MFLLQLEFLSVSGADLNSVFVLTASVLFCPNGSLPFLGFLSCPEAWGSHGFWPFLFMVIH